MLSTKSEIDECFGAVASLDDDIANDRFVPCIIPEKLLGAMYKDYIAVSGGWQPLRGRDVHDAIQMHRSQRLFWPLDARPDEVHVEDVAFSLARQNRFIGQTDNPYNIAWHSVALSNVVPDHLKKWALIHDASEAYISDICRPVKKLPEFDTYRKVEHQLTSVISEAFDMSEREVPEELEQYDGLMGTVELYYNQGDIGIAKLNAVMTDDAMNDYSAKEFKEWKLYVVNPPSAVDSEEYWLSQYYKLFK